MESLRRSRFISYRVIELQSAVRFAKSCALHAKATELLDRLAVLIAPTTGATLLLSGLGSLLLAVTSCATRFVNNKAIVATPVVP